MQAIIDLERLEADLTERFGSAEIAEEIIRDHVEEIAHGWTETAISEQAVMLFTDSLEPPHSNMDLYAMNHKEKIAQKLRRSPRFGVNRILRYIEDINAVEFWIVGSTIQEAIIYVHDSKENLFAIVKEAINECLKS